MHRRERIQWLPLLLSAYLIIIVLFIFVTDSDAIQASHPAYEITLIVVALLALFAFWRSIFRWRRRGVLNAN